jgi:hypothetical protein
MKSSTFTFAVFADQVASRTGEDRVPAALAALADLDSTLAFERTAGDEIQGLFVDPAQVIEAITRLTRASGWRVGVGAGTVVTPLPGSTRAARGPAYVAARAAIQTARRQPTGFALRLQENVGGARYGELSEAATDAETAIWLLRGTLARRSKEGWELMELLDAGLTNAEAAKTLGVSPSAISQRLSVAAREETRRGAQLCARALARVEVLGSQAVST